MPSIGSVLSAAIAFPVVLVIFHDVLTPPLL